MCLLYDVNSLRHNRCQEARFSQSLVHMLHDMTKPALMTFSNSEAINFDFNAKLTDFAMFSYRFNVWLTYCPMHLDYETHGNLLLHIL